MYTVTPLPEKKGESQKIKRKARDHFTSIGLKSVTSDVRVANIIFVNPHGVSRSQLFAYHKNTKTLGDLGKEYGDLFGLGTTEQTQHFEECRFSNASWLLLNQDDPVPPDGSLLLLNHTCFQGTWVTHLYDAKHAKEKRCHWCYKPDAKEKCSLCIKEGGERLISRYCSKECQKMHWSLHKLTCPKNK